MRLLFRQRMFSWFDSYDVYDEAGNTVFTVQGHLDWGHHLHIHDSYGNHIATVRQRVLTMLSKFEFFIGGEKLGELHRKLTLFRPQYEIEFNGWHVEGDVMGWDYQVVNAQGNLVATISKELFHLTDHYVLDIIDPRDALCVLMLVISIDAEKCSNS
ncbi:MAG: LURP-one-related family protein [Firmicutes bacterium]|nr:LURP-one-related family protein [Bacillota bacterium]